MLKRLLMTADTVGGVWTYTLELTGALQAHNVEVSVATMGQALSPAQRLQARRLSNLKLAESQFRLEWMNDPWADVANAGRWLLRLRDAVKPDIIHLNGYVHGALAWGLPSVIVGHSCVLSWWTAVHRTEAPSEWDRYRMEVRHGIAAADLLVAPTRVMLDSLQKHYGPLRQARVIRNGCNPTAFKAGAKEPLILSAGRLWDEAKNVQALVDIAADVSWPVRLAGDGQFETVTSENFSYLGSLPSTELHRWMAQACIYVLPARYEPFGLTVLEAALSGCALVLGDIPSLRENWDGAATFVDSDNRIMLREAIERLIQRPHELGWLASRARARAEQFTAERMAEAYMEAYESVLSSPVQAAGGQKE
jgi:glycogen(starch) synthase